MRRSSRHGSRQPSPQRSSARRPVSDRSLCRELERLIGLLVDEPDEVEVRDYRERSRTCFEVWVDDDDLGKVIGRQGRTARALRALLEARGQLEGRRYALEICED